MSNNQPIIDFRIRPPYKGSWDILRDNEGKLYLESWLQKFNLRYEGSVKSESYEEFKKELDEENIVKAVIPGRAFRGITNENLFRLAEKEPDIFIPFPFVNPLEGQKTLDYIDEYVINGKGKGVTLEPEITFGEAYALDDERVFPVYKKLEENSIPVLVTYGGGVVRDYDVLSTQKLSIVAKTFPKLKIILAHGGWPLVHETIGLAFYNPNIYLAPDLYATYGPGVAEYAAAANTILKDQILFASSYPLSTLKEAIEIKKVNWNLDKDNMKKLFYDNAAKVLGIE